jgi:predicted MPP superfamily phosphohydrolase
VLALPWLASGVSAASAATLVYGCLSESNKIVVERPVLRLPGWPPEKDGYRIAVFADMHIRDRYTVEQTLKAVAVVLEEQPDMCVIAGDFVGYWKESSPSLLEEALWPLRYLPGKVLGILGNHDYWNGGARGVSTVAEHLGIRMLRNEAVELDGITWAGIDSINEFAADPFTVMAKAALNPPVVALWHEPDAVDFLPRGAALMISGHSHGGQFKFPWGWTPMHSRYGEKYVEGFFPDAPTPLYVNRGLSTTGPPARLTVLPEVTILTLVSAGPSS